MPEKSWKSREPTWPNRAQIEQALRQWAAEVARTFPEVVRVGYFGSYARGEWATGSDVDVVIIVRASREPFWRRTACYPYERLPVPADLLVYTEEEWHRLVDQSPFVRTVRQEVRWVYPFL